MWNTIYNIADIILWCFIIYEFIIIFVIPHFKTKNNCMNNSLELKVYLDDERVAPPGWIQVHNYQTCIEILQSFNPTHLSLDHDLGEEKTGYDVVKWIESKTFLDSKYQPPIIMIHSANPAGRQNMQRGIDSIIKILKNRF